MFSSEYFGYLCSGYVISDVNGPGTATPGAKGTKPGCPLVVAGVFAVSVDPWPPRIRTDENGELVVPCIPLRIDG